MTEIPDLTMEQMPRLAMPSSWRPTVIAGDFNGTPSLILIIESANGTFAFTMPRQFAEESLMPRLNNGIVQAGGKSMLAVKIVPATLDDLRHLNGQGGPG